MQIKKTFSFTTLFKTALAVDYNLETEALTSLNYVCVNELENILFLSFWIPWK